MKLKKVKCYKTNGHGLIVRVPKKDSRNLPTYFYADVEINNVEEREKHMGRTKKERRPRGGRRLE